MGNVQISECVNVWYSDQEHIYLRQEKTFSELNQTVRLVKRKKSHSKNMLNYLGVRCFLVPNAPVLVMGHKSDEDLFALIKKMTRSRKKFRIKILRCVKLATVTITSLSIHGAA